MTAAVDGPLEAFMAAQRARVARHGGHRGHGWGGLRRGAAVTGLEGPIVAVEGDKGMHMRQEERPGDANQQRLRAAAREYTEQHMSGTMERIRAMAATVTETQVPPIDATPSVVMAYLSTEIGRIEAIMQETKAAGRLRAGPPRELQIEQALEPHLVSQEDRYAVRAIAAETARWAQAVAESPVEQVRKTLVRLKAALRKARDASSRVGLAHQALITAERALAAETRGILKGLAK